MKQTGTLTPNGKGGYSIEINDGSRQGFVGALVKLGTAALIGGVTWLGGYAMSKVVDNIEKK